MASVGLARGVIPRPVLLLVAALVFLLPGCTTGPSPGKKTCEGCHPLELDAAHDLGCRRCHGGQSPAPSPGAAHRGLVAHPASPARWGKTCGPCHPDQVRDVERSPHFTLAREVNTVRRLFGLPPVASALALPAPRTVSSREDLVSDLLRRRCLRCHLFSPGDGYPETRRGLGCAACHLPFRDGHLADHRFQAPGDRACLHCHYGNRVGWDYYGLAEHDYPYQFRSPLLGGEPPPRPWGVEFHELSPDVHLEAGMSCLACHRGRELMAGGPGPRCLSCHALDRQAPHHRPEVLAGSRCSACHARWAFWDRGFYLVLHEEPDWEEWAELMVQGSWEVEQALASFLTGGEPRAAMRDKFSGEERPGLWLLTLGERRFEEVHLGRDEAGRIAVVRPLGDLHLSYVTREGEVVFDDLRPEGEVLLPYHPHTIGRADRGRTGEVLRLLGGKR